MRPKSDQQVAKVLCASTDKALAGQSISIFGKAPSQEAVSGTEGISELPVRVRVLVAKGHAGQVSFSGKVPDRVFDLSIGRSPEVR